MNEPRLQVVVRASGERTSSACVGLLASQIGSAPIVVRERPFSHAVRRTLELGAESGADWVIAVDADVLVLSDFIARVRGMCGRQPGDVFCATCLVLCRVVGGFVFRGVHLYRGPMLERALGLLDSVDYGLRPETAVQRAMGDRGYPKRYLAHVVGVHDYEQAYRHLYLKAKLRARKDEHRDRIAEALAARAPGDVDALVSLWGFEDAASERDAPAEYDWAAPLPTLRRRLAEAGLDERAEFHPDAAIGYAEHALSRHDYARDTTTAEWIRSRLRFADGAPAIRDGLRRADTT